MSASDHEAAGAAFPHLCSPFSLGDVQLRNRTVFQPHFTALGSLEGMPTDDLAAYHEERARGGVALIVTESLAIHPTGKMSARFLNAWDPAIIPGLTIHRLYTYALATIIIWITTALADMIGRRIVRKRRAERREAETVR